MSHGDHGAENATGARADAAGGQKGDSHPAPSSLGAAPWERFTQPMASAPAPEDAETSGCHTAGELTVADLIKKVGAVPTDRPRRRRAAPDPDPPDFPAPDVDPDDPPRAADTEWPALFGVPSSAYADELPLLEPVQPITGDEHDEIPDAETAPSPRRRRPLLLAGRSLAAVIALLSLVLTGAAWQWSASKNNRLNHISALDPHSRDVLDPNAQFGDENFLIVGMDSRAGANSQMGAGDTEDAGGARSDTVMLVNIPANRKRVVAVSFPRDLAITPVKCEAWNPDTGAYGPLYDDKTGTWGSDMVYSETKLNSAFAFGGPKCLVKVIQKLSGLSINRFMAIDFAGFAKMVDALGGVEVCSNSALEDDELGTVLEHSGRQVIDGTTALKYVRARNLTTEDNGDYGRIKRQQLFLSSLLRSLISRDTFFSLSKLNNVVNLFINDSYVDNVKTKDLVDLGQSVQGLTAGHITFVTIPTTGYTDEDGNEPPRTTDVRALFDAVINDDPLPGENDQNARNFGLPATKTKPPTTRTPTASPSSPARAEQVQAVTTAPQDVTVQVSNATGRSGLATTATTQLEKRGFVVMAPDDYHSSLKTTTVFFSPGNEQAAATVAATLANSKVERVTGIGQVVQVVLGPDFRTVSAPPPTGSPVRVQIDHSAGNAQAKLPEDLSVTNAADTTCE